MSHTAWYRPTLPELQSTFHEAKRTVQVALSRQTYRPASQELSVDPGQGNGSGNRDALLVLLPLLIVLSTLFFLLLLFLACILVLRRKRGIALSDNDGPIDMSREDLIEGEGGFEGVEERWLESVDEQQRLEYRRAKEHQVQYPPNSLPTDITLSQFLSIQEKGVSAWSFEPEYESVPSLLVHARTELTFLPDPFSSTSVQSNLPLPKLNEVYYWEIKLFDLPDSTNIAVGLATKPYPSFRLPGMSRYSVAYHSNGDKSHNYPFTSQTFGPALKEGDVVGIGYRPRAGTVFFTRNGRKLEDAYVGLTRWNLFPTVGADGPCSLHVNLGQSGFVFIEANVKKWGLAPSVGTLAPPPAYGSERGSILLEAGGGIVPIDGSVQSPPSTSISSRRHRTRRPRQIASNAPALASPLRSDLLVTDTPVTPPPPITPIQEETSTDDPQTSGLPNGRYISPTDTSFHTGAPQATNFPPSPTLAEGGDTEQPTSRREDRSSSHSRLRTPSPFANRNFNSPSHSRNNSAGLAAVRLLPPPDSPMNPEPPTPNPSDIHLDTITPTSSRSTSEASTPQPIPNDALIQGATGRPPPAYSPLDAYRYADGVHVDLPAEVIAAALEGGAIPSSAIGQTINNPRTERHRSRRDRRRN